MSQDSLSYKDSEIVNKIETKWLPVGHLGVYICKMCYVLSFYLSILFVHFILYYWFSYHAIFQW